MYHVLDSPDAPSGAAPLLCGFAVGGACCGGARASRSAHPFRAQDTPLS